GGRDFPHRGTFGPDFSTLWKNIRKVLPLCGKSVESFSIAWNNLTWFFHTVEKTTAKVPHCGKEFSTVWKR
ncbi:MAG TPA: hypothetical protein PK180_09285, partial [Kiritimatiellia bacterium]|nr:hypothetical protein [Kiritimatiellia bacterium]